MKVYKCYKDKKYDATSKVSELELNGHRVLNMFFSEIYKQWVISYHQKEDLDAQA